MAINFNLNSNEKKTFALLRTNPKLTANIKLVADSNGGVFLSAFAANKTLSQSKYQKFAISDEGSYSTDVAKFFRDCTLVEAYQVLRKFSDVNAYSEYEYQYENQYNYGATFNTAKVYGEQYKMLAPIWLDKKVPQKFVIYRVKDTDYSEQFDNNTLGQNDRVLELLKNATIVKSYDLTRASKLGKYLHKHVVNKELPASPLKVNFNLEGETFFRGIDIKSGGFASKSEFITKELVKADYPEIVFNRIFSDGFERNGLVSANLINLEFMFDDKYASNYDIYRYFGIYVDEVNESIVNAAVSNQGYAKIESNTIDSLYDLDTNIQADWLLPTVEDLKLPTLNYYKAGNGQYFHIKNATDFNNYELPLAFDNINEVVNDFKKDDVVKLLDETADNRGFVRLNIVEKPNDNDKILVGDLTEIESANYDLYKFTFVADSTLAAGKFNGQRFSNQGTLVDVTAALNNAISFYQTQFQNNTLLINDYAAGNSRKRMIVATHGQNFTNFVDFEYARPIQNQQLGSWNVYSTRGGSAVGAVKLVSAQEKGKLEIGDYVKNKNLTEYVKIVDITPNLFDDTKFRVIFAKPVVVSNSSSIQTWVKYKPIIGKFNAYDLKDFDFDFHSTKMSNIGELSLTGSDLFNNLDGVLQEESIVKDVVESNSVNSEYDRLNENELKESALLSRMVPTIMKFSLKDSFNARNLPYTLNISEAFGADNISPDITYTNGRNIDALNMEHFHLNQIPQKYYTNNNLSELQSYTDFKGSNGISVEQLKSTDTNYFELYFKYNGALNTITSGWADSIDKTLYSKFSNGSTQLEPSTVFRGLRYLYKKRKEHITRNPSEFIKTTEVNDYKFGVVLNYVTEGVEESTVSYKVIKNDKFKFICVVLNLNVVPNSRNSLDRLDLYNAINIINSSTGFVLDTDLPFGFAMSAVNDWDQKEIDIYVNTTTYDLDQFITRNEAGEYSYILFDAGDPNDTDPVTGASIVKTWAMRVINVSQNFITVNAKPIEVTVGPNNESLVIGVAELESGFPRFMDFKYWRGGEAGFKFLLDEIVANRFADRFNQFDNIEYITITENGEELEDRFVLSVEDGVEIIKPSLLDTTVDPDKPKAYQSSNEVGSILKKRNDGGYFTILRRMNGDYNPMFNDVITFTDVYTNRKTNIPQLGDSTITVTSREGTIYNKVNNLGVAFSSYKNVDQNFGFINNYYFHKVNDINSKNLLKLSETTDKLPLYPKIGEIAIDRKDLNVLKSKYNQDYFTRSLPGLNKENAHGTLSPVEVKAFLASTVMKVKDTYEITAYDQYKEFDLNDLDQIRANKLNKGSLHWIETETQIIADFYLPKSIYNELIEDGIAIKFRKYLEAANSYGDKDSLEDDLEIYVYKNIVNRFIIDNIEIYGTEFKNAVSSFNSVDDPTQLLEDGYTSETNYEIESYQNDGLSFRLTYNKKYGYGHSLRVHVKIEA